MSRYTINGTLSADVAAAGTFTVSYPTGTNKGTYQGGVDHQLVIGANPALRHLDQFLAAPGATNITITNRGTSTWVAGSTFTLSLEVPGTHDLTDEKGRPAKRSNSAKIVQISLGSPITADADGISASQSVGAGANALLNGALLSGGKMVLDVPRNVVGAWTTASVITVTGKDEYGNTVIESAASGTTYTGKKAFKEITSISSSAAITLATFGTGDVLGLPVFLDNAGYILKELEDNAAAGAGTAVVADTAKATATTGDVRGTYDPASAADGSKAFRLLVALSDPVYFGAEQYDG